MIPRTLVLLSLAAGLAGFPTLVSGQRTTSDGRPNLEGIWNSGTATPIERPRELKDKPFFTPAEAAAWERQVAKQNEEPASGTATRGTGTYNGFYREWGTRVVKTLRTSIVTEPPDGRIPALTPAAAEVKRQRLERLQTLRESRRSRAAGPLPRLPHGRTAAAAVFLQQQLPDRADT